MMKERLDINRIDLWKGSILKSIAHAINVGNYPELSYESSWDNFNYNLQDGEGTRGTITFHPDFCIAAFQDLNSERSQQVKDPLYYLEGASDKLKEVAQQETFQYLLEDVEGETIPLVTSAFWIENDNAYSIDTFEEFQKHGGFLIEMQLEDITSLMEILEEEYEMTEQQLNLLQLIFDKKINAPEEKIVLSEGEVDIIDISEEEGRDESEELFKELNIVWRI
ncbi:hypothetical protein [Bacillus mycoides]|uniref:hypothetical protein n=1 Tax=Bacillus mycoides TaxID=1405 RepID=UPI003A7FBE5E